MKLGTHLLPAKEHHGDERRLHEEGQNALNGKRRTEDVAHKPTVIAPVGAKLKLQDDASGHADGEIHAKDGHPELGGGQPLLAARAQVDGFHDGHNHTQAERERHEEPVIDGRKRKLSARPVNDLC